MKLAHTMLRVRDIKKSLDFYETFIGLHEVERKDLGDATLVFLTDEKEEYFLELTYNHDDRNYDLGDQFGHLALTTKNLDSVIEKIKAREWSYRLSKPESTSRYVFIKDPDGYDIEILQEK